MNNILTQTFVAGLFDLANRPLSAVHKLQVSRFLLDYVGVTLAGARLSSANLSNLLRDLGNLDQTCTVIGFQAKADMRTAAFINGMSAHAAELDDGVRFCSIHPGAPIISALLPLAEKESIDPERLLLAIALGYEAAVRMAMAIQPGHRNSGYHATGTCGAIGAAIATAVAMNLPLEKMMNAFSIGVCSSSGMLKVMEGLSDIKPINSANAASSGSMAGVLARSGLRAPDEVLASPRGMLAMTADKVITHYLTDFTNGFIALDMVYVKPYAACRHAHAPIAAALDIKAEHEFDLSKIERVEVRTYNLAVDGHDHVQVLNSGSAKMSTPYSVAVSLVTGQAGIDQFSDKYLNDVKVQNLMSKVHVVVDTELQAQTPLKRPAIVTIHMLDGILFQKRVDLPLGEPENPLSSEALNQKFHDLVVFSGGSEKTASDLLMRINNQHIAGPEFFGLLAGIN